MKGQLVISLTATCVLFFGAAEFGRPAKGDEQASRQFRTAFPLGALRSASPMDAKVAASVLLKRIVHQQGYTEYTTDIPETKAEFLAGLRTNSYDFVLIETLDYLELRDEFPMEPRIAGASEVDHPMETYILLVREGSVEAGLAGIKDKQLLIERGGATLSKLWLEVLLAEQGLGVTHEHFNEISVVANTSEGVLPIFFGKADACLVTKTGFDVMAELNPQISRRLKALHVSEPMLMSLMCLREGFVERVPGQLVDVSTRLHQSPDGHQILNMMRVKRLLPWDDSFLDSVNRLLARHRLLTGGSKIPTAEDSITSKQSAQDSGMLKEAANRLPETVADDFDRSPTE